MAAIVVSGALAAKAGNGGEAWVRMSWACGLRQLGHDVAFVEHAPGATPEAAAWFDDVTSSFGLDDTAELVTTSASAKLEDRAAAADLLVDISGNLSTSSLFERFRRRVYVDLDPGFTQIWHHDGLPGARLDRHHAHFTVGENIGRPECPVPTGGIMWRPTRQPVTLNDWPTVDTDNPARLTTVATWRTPFGRVTHKGRRYGLKLDEFRRLAALPTAVGQTLEVALRIDDADCADRELLESNGWAIVSPSCVSAPDAFRDYVQRSGGEFSVAQGIYVETACGWFSDRTARYLASGHPVLVQDTGFARTFPVGEGLIAFTTFAEAVEGAERIASDYAAHSRAARRIAEEELDSSRVLTRFLEEALL